MAATDQVLRGVMVGAPYKITREVDGIQPNAALLNMVLKIKNSLDEPDSEAVFMYTISIVQTALGQIISNGAETGHGLFFFFLPDASIKAQAVLNPGAPDSLVLYTAINPGYAGNNISIAYTVPNTLNAALTIETVGTNIKVSCATTMAGGSATTAMQVAAAINADPSASQLVQAAAINTGLGVLANLQPVFLTGGNSGTETFSATQTYCYQIFYNTISDSTFVLFENGTFQASLSTDTELTVALATHAQAIEVSPRVDTILNKYLDTIIHDFRQIRVWDEHARRSAGDPFLLRLSYRHLNLAFYPEVFDGQNNPVPPKQYAINFIEGNLRIAGDLGFTDYFVTYEFNLFPAEELQALLNLTLQEVNVAGEAGDYLTSYSTVEETPLYWDAPLTLGTAAKAFKRLATDSLLWANYLIWADPNNGPQLAQEASQYYQELFSTSAARTKKAHYIALPTAAFTAFESTGFGNFGILAGKFRELRLNTVNSFAA